MGCTIECQKRLSITTMTIAVGAEVSYFVIVLYYRLSYYKYIAIGFVPVLAHNPD